MEAGQFEGAFVRCVGKKKSLVELPGGDCVFFDNRTRQLLGVRCPAHPVPHLAVLGVERPLAGGVGRDVPGMSRERAGPIDRAGADRRQVAVVRL